MGAAPCQLFADRLALLKGEAPRTPGAALRPRGGADFPAPQHPPGSFRLILTATFTVRFVPRALDAATAR